MPTMTYAPLGACGMKVSRLSLGGWTTYGDSVRNDATVAAIIRKAYEAGVNFYDMADMYGYGKTEEAMGRVLAEFPRHTLVLSSKLFVPMSDDVNDRGLSRKHIMESIDRSLRRIGMDYLDIYFCHRYDPETPLEETVRAMDDLVHQGKILYWGTSEWSREQLNDALELCAKHGYYRPQVEQPQYNLMWRRIERDILPSIEPAGMGTVVWSPLASGVLSGKYDNGIPDGSRLAQEKFGSLRNRWLQDGVQEKVRAFGKIAAGLGCSSAQLALAWILANPSISSVITGATQTAQLEENLGALDVQLDDGLKAQLDDLLPDASLPGN